MLYAVHESPNKQPDIGRIIPQAALDWVINGDTGASSLTIWGVMMDVSHSTEKGRALFGSIPYDPDDFDRCHRLLQILPEWRQGLDRVASRFPAWAPFVAAWDELTALYQEERPSGRAPKLFARMQELRRQPPTAHAD